MIIKTSSNHETHDDHRVLVLICRLFFLAYTKTITSNLSSYCHSIYNVHKKLILINTIQKYNKIDIQSYRIEMVQLTLAHLKDSFKMQFYSWSNQLKRPKDKHCKIFQMTSLRIDRQTSLVQ